MGKSQKVRRPANDQPKRASRALSYVVVARPFWGGRRIAAALILASFLSGLGGVLVAGFWPAPRRAVEDSRAAQEPFDITISGSALDAPPEDATAAVAAALPKDVLTPGNKRSNAKMPPVLDVQVEGDNADAEGDAYDKEEKAEHLARLAKNFLREGALEQALSFQERAATLDPSNPLYQLSLAILCDRSGDGPCAMKAYRRVLKAYEAQDETLPDDLDVEGIRLRLAYLSGEKKKGR